MLSLRALNSPRRARVWGKASYLSLALFADRLAAYCLFCSSVGIIGPRPRSDQSGVQRSYTYDWSHWWPHILRVKAGEGGRESRASASFVPAGSTTRRGGMRLRGLPFATEMAHLDPVKKKPAGHRAASGTRTFPQLLGESASELVTPRQAVWGGTEIGPRLHCLQHTPGAALRSSLLRRRGSRSTTAAFLFFFLGWRRD